MATDIASIHSRQSSSREKLIEHLFISELLKLAWKSNGQFALEISKPEVDNAGYDIIIEKGREIRHVQLKTRRIGGRTDNWNVHIALEDKPAGCVILIDFHEDTLELGPFHFFGKGPSERLTLPGTVAKHSRGNKDGVKAERPDIRIVKIADFTDKRLDLQTLLKLMFTF